MNYSDLKTLQKLTEMSSHGKLTITGKDNGIQFDCEEASAAFLAVALNVLASNLRSACEIAGLGKEYINALMLAAITTDADEAEAVYNKELS